MKRGRQNSAVLLAALILVWATAPTNAQILLEQDVMVAGIEGYSVYRIPGFAVADDGSLMLFAEGRPSGSDPGGAGDIDMVYKRSTDGGLTWSPLSVLHVSSGFDYSDPRVVVDENTGTVHLQYVQWPTRCGQTCVPVGLGDNSSVVFHQTSTDHGATWSGPSNINAQVKDPSWASFNTGPGIGIQLKWQDSVPARNGRLLMPGHRRPPAYEGVSIYSDDGGLTWTHGSGATPNYADESEVIELTNGDLLWDARRGGSGRNRSISHDGGDTWVDGYSGDIPISAVDSGMVRYSAAREGDDRDRILYSGPLGNPAGAGNGRTNIGVWTSYDEGQTFINPVQIQSGSAAYSVIDRLQNGTIGLIYEVNHNTIRYVNFGMDYVEGAAHNAAMSHFDGFGNSIDALRGGVGWSGSWQANGNVSQELGGLEFTNMAVASDVNRLRIGGGDLTRGLGTGTLDLDADQSYFVSLFVRSDSDGGDQGSQEFLDVTLNDGATTMASLGVGSSENFFAGIGPNTSSSAHEALAIDTEYFLLAKITASNSGDDEIMLTWYDDVANLPADEGSVTWEVTDSANLSGVINNIEIAGGSNASWNVDALRIGTTFDSVVFTDGVLPDILGDLDMDADVDIDDWIEFKANYGADTSSLFLPARHDLGDLDASGLIDLDDLDMFRGIYDSFNGAGAFAALGTAVPEPSTFLLLAIGTVAYLRLRPGSVRLA